MYTTSGVILEKNIGANVLVISLRNIGRMRLNECTKALARFELASPVIDFVPVCYRCTKALGIPNPGYSIPVLMGENHIS